MTSNTSSNPPKHEPDCPYNYGHNCSCLPSSRPMTLRQQLDDILNCNCGGNDILNGKHYSDCAKQLAPALESLCQEIAREARLEELKSLDRLTTLKLSENDDMGLREYPHKVYKIIQSRLAELTSPDTTAAGNDLPSYDPKADIEATLRRKGQLTQKPPQEEPK